MTEVALSLSEIEQLGELLAAVPGADEALEPDELDGFLVCLSLLSEPPAIERWLPYTLDPQDGRAAAPSGRLRSLILRRARQLERALLHGRDVDPIVFADQDGDYGPASLAGFSRGFGLACSLWPELLSHQSDKVRGGLVGALRYYRQDDQPELAEIWREIDSSVPLNDLDEALADLESCLRDIVSETRADETRVDPTVSG